MLVCDETCEHSWLSSCSEQMCEVDEVKVMAWYWGGHWIDFCNFGVRLKINDCFVGNNRVCISVFKGVKSIDLIIITFNNWSSKWSYVFAFSRCLYCVTLLEKISSVKSTKWTYGQEKLRWNHNLVVIKKMIHRTYWKT